MSRSQRVAESIKKELGSMIEQGEIKDPRIGFVTFTEVEVSPDIRHARIYFSILGNKKQKKETGIGLNSAKGFIRTEISKRLRLKYVPDLEFIYDVTVETSARISRLIRETSKGEEAEKGNP